jgi:hypothetical protein
MAILIVYAVVEVRTVTECEHKNKETKTYLLPLAKVVILYCPDCNTILSNDAYPRDDEDESDN